MVLSLTAVVFGFLLLIWGADRFVTGSAITARHFGMPPLMIGMVIVGFGTSAPEMMVAAIAAIQGEPGIALGNAYGSNIANISLVLGISALICPIAVRSRVLRKELPILACVTVLAGLQIYDGTVTRIEAFILLAVFAGLMTWTIWQGTRKNTDTLGNVIAQDLDHKPTSIKKAVLWLIAGLLVLIASSRLLVWGAVNIAQQLGVSNLIIGLTVVAVGTSLPEIASSIIAARKGEHDIAIGNVLGSNLFNTLAVVGIAGTIHPMSTGPEVFYRDIMLMAVLTLSLFVICYGFRGPGRINRFEGGLLLTTYIAYTAYLTHSIFEK